VKGYCSARYLLSVIDGTEPVQSTSLQLRRYRECVGITGSVPL
jgi:hypothetical protein